MKVDLRGNAIKIVAANRLTMLISNCSTKVR